MENTTEKENRSLSPAFSPKSPPGAEDVQWCEECANVAQEICEKCKKAQCEKCHNKHIPFCERIAGMEGEPSEVTMAKIVAESSSSNSSSSSSSESATTATTATATVTATTESATTATTVTAATATTATATVTATTATTVTAATATKTAQMEKDKFRRALDEAEGDTLLLSMWEAGKPCELKAFNGIGQEVPTEIVEITVRKTTGGQDMTLSACIGTGIMTVNRKNNNLFNYIAAIAKKAEVKTWSEAETLLWEEYNKNWIRPK